MKCRRYQAHAATCLGFGGMSPFRGVIEATDWGMELGPGMDATGHREGMVKVHAPCDPSRWCMRYSGSKGCCLSCLDPRHVHICPTTIIPAAAPKGSGESPCRPSFQDHGPFRHPDPCQALLQSDGSPVARAHLMRIAMQSQQLCLQPQR